MRPAAPSTVTQVTAAVECTFCGVQMTSHVGSGGQIRYFHCPSCQRWTTSVYAEVFRGDTKMRTRLQGAPPPPSQSAPLPSSDVGARVRAWLEGLSVVEGPWQVLGCRPTDSDEQVRERYLALARTHHPDRGGRVEEMTRVNQAYEAILAQRARQRSGRLTPALSAS